jgi:DNA-binding MarR family transcriptional regulator
MIDLAAAPIVEEPCMPKKNSPRESRADRLGREAFISLFVTSSRFTADIEQLCKAEGISHSQYSILWVLCLADDPDGLPMGALADGLLHRSADATRLVDRLLTSGHVTRTPKTNDRRVVIVAPTKLGRATFERLTEQIKALHRQQWAGLTLTELDELNRLLNKALWAGIDPADAPSLLRP